MFSLYLFGFWAWGQWYALASAERIKMVLAIINLGWDTLVRSVEFPINS
jgi:hypothetical protein